MALQKLLQLRRHLQGCVSELCLDVRQFPLQIILAAGGCFLLRGRFLRAFPGSCLFQLVCDRLQLCFYLFQPVFLAVFRGFLLRDCILCFRGLLCRSGVFCSGRLLCLHRFLCRNGILCLYAVLSGIALLYLNGFLTGISLLIIVLFLPVRHLSPPLLCSNRPDHNQPDDSHQS